MFTLYALKREMRLNGVLICVRLYVDAEKREAHAALTVDRILQPREWHGPFWHEVDTPAKAEAWINKVDLDSLSYSYARRSA